MWLEWILHFSLCFMWHMEGCKSDKFRTCWILKGLKLKLIFFHLLGKLWDLGSDTKRYFKEEMAFVTVVMLQWWNESIVCMLKDISSSLSLFHCQVSLIVFFSWRLITLTLHLSALSQSRTWDGKLCWGLDLFQVRCCCQNQIGSFIFRGVVLFWGKKVL